MKISARKLRVSLIIVCIALLGLSFAATVIADYPYPGQSTCRLTVRTNINGGWVYPQGENYYLYGSTVTVSESTYSGYVFVGWFMDGEYQGKLSTISLTMTRDYDLYAVFQQRMSILTITTNPSDGGTTVPPAGIYNYTSQTVRVYEYPATGNNFSGWYLDGVYQGLGTSIPVDMSTGDHQLTAFFSGSGVIPPTPTPTVTPTPEPTPPAAANIPVPTLSFYCVSSTSLSGFHVKINGALAYPNGGVPGAGIRFSYSATGGLTWHDLAYVITGQDGNFSVAWMPTASGNYLIKGEYTFYSNVSTIVEFAVTPNPDNQMFSVSSNSTLSSLAYNSATNQLSFTVTGATGTFGYVEACIPKTLLSDASSLQVTLDGTITPFTVLSEGDTWLITIMYHHSTHAVVMDLDSSTSTPTPSQSATSNPTNSQTNSPTGTSNPTATPAAPELSPIVVLPLIVVMLGLAMFVVMRRHTTNPK